MKILGAMLCVALLGACGSSRTPAAVLATGTTSSSDGAIANADSSGSGDDDATKAETTNSCDDDNGCASHHCVAGACVACVVAADCKAAGTSCFSGKCVVQTPCKSDKQCADLGLVCDGGAGVCVECLSSSDCGNDGACKAHHCVAKPAKCASSKDCGAAMVCDKANQVCVECATDGDCDFGAVCVETVCALTICLPGQTECSDALTLRTCAEDGQAWTEATCPPDTKCEAGACLQLVCEPGQKSCQGNAVATCNSTGTDFNSVEPCPGNQFCANGECESGACTAGAIQCQGGQVATCLPDGSGWSLAPCPSGKTCAAGTCAPKICAPAQASCKGNQVMVCDATGTTLTPGADCGGKGQTCVAGSCVPQVCTPLSKSCSGAKALTCNADGTSYGQTEDCAASGKVCLQGVCQYALCTPGQTKCFDAGTVATCDSAGSQWQKTKDCKALGQTCSGGVCVASQSCVPGAVQCVGADLQTCKADGSGWESKPCNDGNVCTQDSCTGTTCMHPPAPDLTACSDGSACTTNDVCKAGTCLGEPQLWTLSLSAPPGKIESVATAKTGGWLAGGSRIARISTTGKVLWEKPMPTYAVRRVAERDGGWVALASSQNAALMLDDLGNSAAGWTAFGVATQFQDIVGHGTGAVMCGFEQGANSVARINEKGVITQFVPLEAGSTAAAIIVGLPQGGFVIGLNGAQPALMKVDDNLVAGNANPISGWPDSGDTYGLTSMAVEADGTLVVGGTYFDLTGSPKKRAVVMRVTSVGVPIWSQKLDLSAQTGVTGLSVVDGGAVSVLIFSASPNQAQVTNHMRFSADGALLWRRQLPVEPGYPMWVAPAGGAGAVICGTGLAGGLMYCSRVDGFNSASCDVSGACFEKSATECDDANLCTNNGCSGAAGCTYENVADGMACGAKNTCSAGACVP